MLLAWFLFGAVWGILHLAIVPRIGDFRPQLEAAASRLLGAPVRIQAIAAYSTGMLPAFELTGVSLLDAQQRPALRLPRILVSLSPRSLLSLKFDQLYIDSPTLNIRRAADGKITVAGLDMSGSEADAEVLDRIFSQPEFVIRHGAVVWTDEMRAVPALALRDVDLVLRNAGRRHELRLDATPPADWGERFSLMARFEQPFLSMSNGRWKEWSGQVYASFDHVDVSQLKRHADLGLDLREGRGAVRAWVEIRRAQLTAVTADLALADVGVGLDPTLQPLQLATLSGRLAGKFSPGNVEVSTQDLAFDTADGLRWPGGNLQWQQSAGDAARPAHGEFSADRLDLAALTQIGSRIPLGAPVHAALARFAPGGLVERVRAKWQGTPDAMRQYEVQGKVLQLSTRAQAGRPTPNPPGGVAIGTPGIIGATVDFALTEAGGKATLLVQDGAIEFPGVFEEPRIALAQLSGELSWQVEAGKTVVHLSNTRFSNADAEGALQLHWQTSDPARSRGGAQFPGILDLQGSLSRADGTRVYRYLPLMLHQPVRDYVRDAVLAGEGSAVKFKVKGDLHDMPFADPRQGEFRISANIRNGVLAYVPRSLQSVGTPPWPAVSQLAGELVFERKSLQINGARGVLTATPAVQITRADALIADLERAPQLALGVDLRGPIADMLAVVNGSPLAALSGNALAAASATGSADVRLKMAVPLDTPDKTGVQGTVALTGNDLQLAPDTPRLLRARGVVNFSESGFSVNGLQARVLGGDMRLDGGTVAASVATGSAAAPRPAPGLSFRAQGVATAEGLRQAPELGLAARLAQRASGSAAYVATFGLRAGVPEMSLSSNLAGMALDLPPPFGKSAEALLPLRLESALLRDGVPLPAGARARLQDQLVMELGRVASVTYVRDLSGPSPRVVRGAIAVGLAADELAPLPADGVVANISMQQLDLDAWGQLLTQATGTPLEGLDPNAPAPSDRGAAAEARGYLPQTVAVRARALSSAGRTLHNLVAGGSREGLTWRANLAADELNGYVEYRQPAGSGAGRVFARLARLTLAQSSAAEVENLLDEQPASIPALDIVVDDLELRGKKLGRVEIEAQNRFVVSGDTRTREWRLNKFDVITPEAQFRATGNWAALNLQVGSGSAPATGRPEARRTVMNFRLDIVNSGELLTRFGMKDVVRRGKGSMEGQIAWAGSPLSLDYPTLGGAFRVDVENGQFLKADPGLAKLLGVLSLQSLPRRLALDFRDVFSEGFAFDFFRGDVRINQGIASSNNLQMKGVNAAVLMDGHADLSRETQDIKVVVVPEINAGTASLIASAINPAVGLGTFLAQLFLRRPLMEAATQQFHVDGSWVEPRIQRVSRTSAPGAGPQTNSQGGETP